MKQAQLAQCGAESWHQTSSDLIGPPVSVQLHGVTTSSPPSLALLMHNQ